MYGYNTQGVQTTTNRYQYITGKLSKYLVKIDSQTEV